MSVLCQEKIMASLSMFFWRLYEGWLCLKLLLLLYTLPIWPCMLLDCNGYTKRMVGWRDEECQSSEITALSAFVFFFQMLGSRHPLSLLPWSHDHTRFHNARHVIWLSLKLVGSRTVEAAIEVILFEEKHVLRRSSEWQSSSSSSKKKPVSG